MSAVQLQIRSGRPPQSVNATDTGSIFTNNGPDTVYYGVSPSIDSSTNDGSIASGSAATLYGTQYLAHSATAGSALVTVASQYPAGTLPWTQMAGSGAITVPSGGEAAISGRRRVSVATAASLTSGTDTTPTSGTVYYGEVFVPGNATYTGIGYLIGSVGGTDKAIVTLYNAVGTVVANSEKATGTTVGTTATFQEIAFVTAYAAVGPALYFISVSVNGNTCRLRTVAAGSVISTGSATGVFGTLAAITPPTTFTADKAPIAYLYQ